MYLEFLRVPDLSMGLYKLTAGQDDLQTPHNQDEVYYVIKGQGQLKVKNEDYIVQSGSVVYVPKHTRHKFHSITQDLTVMVMFAPAEL